MKFPNTEWNANIIMYSTTFKNMFA